MRKPDQRGNGMGRLSWVVVLSCFISVASLASAPEVKHVVQVIFENEDYTDVLRVPFFSKIAAEGVSFSHFSAITHPSQPNYIAMIAGSTLGTLSDGRVNLSGRHLGDLLEEKGLDWRAYAEGFPGNCFLGMSQGKYARKHVPFLSFTNVQTNPKRCAKVVSSDAFFSDVKNHSLPAYSMFIPNLDHDGHDTGVKAAGQYLSDEFGGIFADHEVMKDTLFILTFDEGGYLGKNQIYTVMMGANAKAGIKVDERLNHYSVLQMIESIFGLGVLNRNDCSASKVPDIWE